MRTFIFLLCTLIISDCILGQISSPVKGSLPEYPKVDCLPEEQRAIIIDRIKNSADYNNFPAATKSKSDPFLSWPLRYDAAPENENDGGYYGISNYVDNNLFYPDQVRDFTCGDRTYDTQWGYNHSGVDIFPWPFTWHKMLEEEMIILAAAEGIVTDVVDGNFDMNCGDLSQSAPVANSITIRHPNGFYTTYLHLKKNSIPQKVGDFVVTGQQLGVVGSSGNSTGPHLHFEVWDDQFRIIEPFYDPEHDDCHVHIDNSLWLEQEPYKNPTIVKVMTSSTTQTQPSCINDLADERINAQDQFSFGDSIFCYLYLRDQDEDDNVNIQLTNPDGTSVYQFDLNCSSTPGSCFFYNSSWWYFPFVFSEGSVCGEYRFSVRFHDELVTHTFMLEEKPFAGPIIGNLTAEPNTTETYSLENPEPGTTYYWYALGGEVVGEQNMETVDVLWKDNAIGNICLIMSTPQGCGSDPNCQQVQLAPSSTEELKKNKVSLIPNPFVHNLSLVNSKLININSIEVYDSSGQKQLAFAGGATLERQLDLSTLAAGVYFLKITSDDAIQTEKVVKF